MCHMLSCPAVVFFFNYMWILKVEDITLDNRGYKVNIFLISPQNLIWVVIRSTLLRI